MRLAGSDPLPRLLDCKGLRVGLGVGVTSGGKVATALGEIGTARSRDPPPKVMSAAIPPIVTSPAAAPINRSRRHNRHRLRS